MLVFAARAPGAGFRFSALDRDLSHKGASHPAADERIARELRHIVPIVVGHQRMMPLDAIIEAAHPEEWWSTFDNAACIDAETLSVPIDDRHIEQARAVHTIDAALIDLDSRAFAIDAAGIAADANALASITRGLAIDAAGIAADANALAIITRGLAFDAAGMDE
jgi:hypothetical protein